VNAVIMNDKYLISYNY